MPDGKIGEAERQALYKRFPASECWARYIDHVVDDLLISSPENKHFAADHAKWRTFSAGWAACERKVVALQANVRELPEPGKYEIENCLGCGADLTNGTHHENGYCLLCLTKKRTT